jgi:L-alanine-DL-glutamate epimerase-like enolase superfamily enzyme
MFYGRKGLPVAVISVIDLAIWDLLGKIRNEPVYKLIGGATRERLDFYCTGPEPSAAKDSKLNIYICVTSAHQAQWDSPGQRSLCPIALAKVQQE